MKKNKKKEGEENERRIKKNCSELGYRRES